MSTIPVKNVARRPVDLEGGRVLAHAEQGDAPDSPMTAAQLAAGLLVRTDQPRAPRGGD